MAAMADTDCKVRRVRWLKSASNSDASEDVLAVCGSSSMAAAWQYESRAVASPVEFYVVPRGGGSGGGGGSGDSVDRLKIDPEHTLDRKGSDVVEMKHLADRSLLLLTYSTGRTILVRPANHRLVTGSSGGF